MLRLHVNGSEKALRHLSGDRTRAIYRTRGIFAEKGA